MNIDNVSDIYYNVSILPAGSSRPHGKPEEARSRETNDGREGKHENAQAHRRHRKGGGEMNGHEIVGHANI